MDKKKIARKQFLPSITTTAGANWRRMVKDIDKLGLKKIALFLTCLDKENRQELYSLISKTGLNEVPFAHLRSDIAPAEIDWLVANYKTKVFNLHAKTDFPHLYDYSAYKSLIYIENVYASPRKRELDNWAGICLDFSHLENSRLLGSPRYKRDFNLLKKYPVGCNHISAILPEVSQDEFGYQVYTSHHFKSLSNFDYLKNYPRDFFSPYLAMELDNPLKDQLTAIDYLLKILN